jgi:ABC-type phosphate/phosphonate transport system substrate-binding protein
MRASLPMYDLPELRAATDAFWAAIAERMQLSVILERKADWSDAWHQPDLVFSQTCGYPLTHELAGKLTYVATPHYDADGCDGPDYRSIIYARESKSLADFRGARAAFNSPDSMSGMLALKAVFVRFAEAGRFFGDAVETGGHVASARAVQVGEADVCALDCVTVALLRRYRPEALLGLVEVARSPVVPGLPFVTRVATASHLRKVLHDVMVDNDFAEYREALLLKGLSSPGVEAYQVIPHLERTVIAQGDVFLWAR